MYLLLYYLYLTWEGLEPTASAFIRLALNTYTFSWSLENGTKSTKSKVIVSQLYAYVEKRDLLLKLTDS